MKKTIITILLALAAMAGQAQVKCHVEGELRDTTQGVTVVICPADVDIRVSDNYITAQADAQGRFSCDVGTDKMRLYNVFLHEQWKHGSWRNENFLVENNSTVTLCFDDNTWKVVSGGSEQMLKVKMDAEAERLYVSKLNEIKEQAEKEIRPRVEELQKQGKNPEEDTLLMKRNREFMAEYEISDSHSDRVRVGGAVILRIGKERLSGTINTVTPLSQSGAITFTVVPDDMSHPRLRSGLKTEVFVITSIKDDVLRIRNGSFYSGPGDYTLFITDGDLLLPRQVRLGECNYDYIEVISGLEAGEQVVVSDMTKYKGKEKLKVN